MQQMAIDAAIFQNFPGGMKAKGIKTTNNDLNILPGQFVTVETGNYTGLKNLDKKIGSLVSQ
jgi:hypothetical protein